RNMAGLRVLLERLEQRPARLLVALDDVQHDQGRGKLRDSRRSSSRETQNLNAESFRAKPFRQISREIEIIFNDRDQLVLQAARLIAWMLSLLGARDRQRKGEGRALVRAWAFHPDPPLVRLHDLPAQGQPQARAANPLAFGHVAPMEALEN